MTSIATETGRMSSTPPGIEQAVDRLLGSRTEPLTETAVVNGFLDWLVQERTDLEDKLTALRRRIAKKLPLVAAMHVTGRGGELLATHGAALVKIAAMERDLELIQHVDGAVRFEDDPDWSDLRLCFMLERYRRDCPAEGWRAEPED